MGWLGWERGGVGGNVELVGRRDGNGVAFVRIGGMMHGVWYVRGGDWECEVQVRKS